MKVNREWKSKGTDRPGRNRTRAAPRRSDIMPASSSSPSHPSGGDEGKSKGANRTRRDRTCAKDAADILASSSPLFRSVCCLTVRTIASGSPSHPVKGMGGHPARLWVMLSPPPRQRSANNKRGAGLRACLSSCRLSLASCCLLLPLCIPRSLVPLFVLIFSARSCLTFCPPSCRLSQPMPRW